MPDHNPATCPQCDLAGLEAHMQMLLPLEQLACDLETWLTAQRAQLRTSEANLIQHALRTLCQGIQTIHDRED